MDDKWKSEYCFGIRNVGSWLRLAVILVSVDTYFKKELKYKAWWRWKRIRACLTKWRRSTLFREVGCLFELVGDLNPPIINPALEYELFFTPRINHST
jgi:hypothetical protein